MYLYTYMPHMYPHICGIYVYRQTAPHKNNDATKSCSI